MQKHAPETFDRRTLTVLPKRIYWLDLLRLLCAIEIVGFHWLRAAAKTSSFAASLPENFILNYRQLDIGVIEALHRLAVDPSQSWWHRYSYDALDLAFGFGWEAVYVFVLLSGFSLSMSLGQTTRPQSWFSWTGRRLKRILTPFYLISGVVAALMFGALAFSASHKSHAFQEIHQKLMNNIGSDMSGLIWSQLALVNPHAPFWQPFFLAPAWWFVPAILLAYCLFPAHIWLLNRLGSRIFLIVGAAVSLLSYAASLRGWLPEFSWNFVILNECFDFFLGIVLGRHVVTHAGRASIEKWIRSPRLISVAVAIFIAGNICNLYRLTYPLSSLLFTGSLAFCGAAIARAITESSQNRRPIGIDPYHLYLIHQPFAFPLVVVSQLLFGVTAALIGLPIYLCTVLFATMVFSRFFSKVST